MWENIAGAKRYSRPRGFNIAGASAPVVPTPLRAAAIGSATTFHHFNGCKSLPSVLLPFLFPHPLPFSCPPDQGCICQISLGGGVEVLAIEVDDRTNA